MPRTRLQPLWGSHGFAANGSLGHLGRRCGHLRDGRSAQQTAPALTARSTIFGDHGWPKRLTRNRRYCLHSADTDRGCPAYSNRGGTRRAETSRWRVIAMKARAKPRGPPSSGKPRLSMPSRPCRREWRGRRIRHSLVMAKLPLVGGQLYSERGHTFNVSKVVSL
jgi:hypothetical protein